MSESSGEKPLPVAPNDRWQYGAARIESSLALAVARTRRGYADVAASGASADYSMHT